MDSTSYVQILEASNQFLRSQNGILLGFAGVVTAIAAILLGSAAYINFRASRRWVEREVKGVFAEHQIEFQQDLDSRLEEVKTEITEEIKDTAHTINVQTAELHRLWGVSTHEMGRYHTAALRFGFALEGYQKIGEVEFVRMCTDALLELIRKYDQAVSDLDEEEREILINQVEMIPKILARERDEILAILKKPSA